eukprot:10876305-Lingulodinium_polyedra.AAC.1
MQDKTARARVQAYREFAELPLVLATKALRPSVTSGTVLRKLRANGVCASYTLRYTCTSQDRALICRW